MEVCGSHDLPWHTSIYSVRATNGKFNYFLIKSYLDSLNIYLNNISSRNIKNILFYPYNLFFYLLIPGYYLI
jgi:hypothetical protein